MSSGARVFKDQTLLEERECRYISLKLSLRRSDQKAVEFNISSCSCDNVDTQVYIMN